MIRQLLLTTLLATALAAPVRAASNNAAPDDIPEACRGALRAETPEGKVEGWTACIEADPADRVLGAAHYNRALAHSALEDYRSAVSDYDQAAKLLPGDADVFTNRGYAYLQAGRTEAAEEDFTRAAALAPQDPDTYANRAAARVALGKTGAAIHDYDQALGLDPAHPGALRGLAYLLAATPDPDLRDGQRAVQVALRLVRIERTPPTLATLAAAHAEAGQFKAAESVQRQAIDLARAQGQRTGHLEENLARYQRGETYR